MDAGQVRSLKVGYWPLKSSLDSAGDRRRLIFWAKARGHSIITDLSQKLDVIVASENSDFNAPCFYENQVPVVFDLVDAYLSPLNPLNDLMRGAAKNLSGQISGGIKPFSHHIRDFCLNSNAVICSSVEQERIIQNYCSNTHVILDSHDEVPLIVREKHVFSPKKSFQILWEGQTATIRGIKLISPALVDLSKTFSLSLELVTDKTYYVFLNRYLNRSTHELVMKEAGPITDLVNITQWTPQNLVMCARASSMGVLPIDLSVPIQKLKPENRLLLMWRLGLPCLTSPSPSYTRVADAAGVDIICENPDQWSNKIEKLLRDPVYAREEVMRGQLYLSKVHSRDLLLEKWDRAIESVL